MQLKKRDAEFYFFFPFFLFNSLLFILLPIFSLSTITCLNFALFVVLYSPNPSNLMTPTENLPPSQSHQSFRLRGSNSSADEVRIVIRKDTTSGQNFVLWNDILNVFRNAGHVQHGSDVVPYMTDNQFE
jgi:hypothetical protein